jgi:hypothetical protein
LLRPLIVWPQLADRIFERQAFVRRRLRRVPISGTLRLTTMGAEASFALRRASRCRGFSPSTK